MSAARAFRATAIEPARRKVTGRPPKGRQRKPTQSPVNGVSVREVPVAYGTLHPQFQVEVASNRGKHLYPCLSAPTGSQAVAEGERRAKGEGATFIYRTRCIQVSRPPVGRAFL